MTSPDNQKEPDFRPHYRWPWFVLAAVLLGALLSVLWMTKEVERARRIRDANAPFHQTNSSSTNGRY